MTTTRTDEEAAAELLSGPDPYLVPLSRDGREVLSFEPMRDSGWACLFSDVIPDADHPSVFVRFARQGHSADFRQEPIEVRHFRFTTEARGIDFGSDLLRLVPFRRMEAAVNHPDHEAHMRELIPSAVIPFDIPGHEHGIDEEPPDPAEQRRRARWLIRPSPVPPPVRDLRLVVPEGYRRPDSFYADVTDRYLWLAAVSNRPAQDLADAMGVKVSSVHGWVKEAKARGLLRLPKTRRSS